MCADHAYKEKIAVKNYIEGPVGKVDLARNGMATG
jgi:hypothetical protein